MKFLRKRKREEELFLCINRDGNINYPMVITVLHGRRAVEMDMLFSAPPEDKRGKKDERKGYIV
jgi:hypothetical protein